MEVRIYLTNLAKYNEGKLIGKWIDLPIDDDELQKELKAILGSDEEYFITDFEAPFGIEEYESPFKLNEFVWQLEELDEQDQEKMFYLLDTIGYDREEALEHYEDVVFYSGMTLEDVAEELIEDGVFGNLSDTIKLYIDYEKLARDLSIDGYYETDKGTFCYQ
jgi:antirestriction protein